MVVLWTALSYSVPGKVPSQVPRRLVAPLPWEPESLHHWTVVKVSFALALDYGTKFCRVSNVFVFHNYMCRTWQEFRLHTFLPL